MEILISFEASFAMQTRSKGFTTIAFSFVISTQINWTGKLATSDPLGTGHKFSVYRLSEYFPDVFWTSYLRFVSGWEILSGETCFMWTLRSKGLVVKALDSQSRVPVFKTTGWLQVRLSLSSLRGRSNEYQEYLGT